MRGRRRDRRRVSAATSSSAMVSATLSRSLNVDDVALVPVETPPAALVAPAGSSRLDAAACVHHLQAPPMCTAASDHVAALDHAQACGAAADIDIEDALASSWETLRGARAVGRSSDSI